MNIGELKNKIQHVSLLRSGIKVVVSCNTTGCFREIKSVVDNGDELKILCEVQKGLTMDRHSVLGADSDAVTTQFPISNPYGLDKDSDCFEPKISRSEPQLKVKEPGDGLPPISNI